MDQFAEFVTKDVSLAEKTRLHTGGNCDWFAEPSTTEQIVALFKHCHEQSIPIRIIGNGSNIIVDDSGVNGVVVRLHPEHFNQIQINGNQVECGGNASLTQAIAQSCKASLAGLGMLVGVPGSVGGAVRCNAGDRTGDIGQLVQSVHWIRMDGTEETLSRSDIRFGYHTSNLDNGLILSVKLELSQDQPQSIIRRMKKYWIIKRATQPLDVKNSIYLFRDSKGISVADLFDSCGLTNLKVGPIQMFENDRRFVVATESFNVSHLHEYIQTAKERVKSSTSHELNVHPDFWNRTNN